MIDLYTFEPDIGGDTGAEPSVYEILRQHYAHFFPSEVAINYACEYIRQLNAELEK